MAGGRPKGIKQLTPAVQQAIITALAGGNHFSTACEFAGIPPATGQEWLMRGNGTHGSRKSTPQLASFASAIKKAQSDAEVACVAQIKSAASTSWQAAAWWLERKYPDKWAQSHQVNVKVKAEIEDFLHALEAKLPPDIFDQVIAAVMAAGGQSEVFGESP